jgi:pseudouridylate synthase
VAVAQGAHAATTVAATAYLAHRAGVRVFATGGLGGVHRGARTTFDESADLVALARTPIAVVCAGAKSVLDIPATLERMETLGITVLGYRTDRFPGFYVSDSGHRVDQRVEGPAEVAAVMAAAGRLGLTAATVVANPVPAGQQLDPDVHERVLTEALRAAGRAGLRGKPVTPFLLDHIRRETGGASLDANIAAITNNVCVAGEIAAAWARRHAVTAAGAGTGPGRPAGASNGPRTGSPNGPPVDEPSGPASGP